MTTYRPPSVDDVPTVHLANWRAYKVRSKNPALQDTTHIVGWNIDAGDGRVSSPIAKWNPAKRQIVTRSGRVYQLKGDPGTSIDALYVWGVWCRKNAIVDIKDVTPEFVRKGRKPGPKPRGAGKVSRPKKRILTPRVSSVG